MELFGVRLVGINAVSLNKLPDELVFGAEAQRADFVPAPTSD